MKPFSINSAPPFATVAATVVVFDVIFELAKFEKVGTSEVSVILIVIIC